MAKSRIELMLATVAAFAVSTSAFASNTQDASVSNGVETQQVPPTDDPESSGEAEVSADDMADTLNSMQQLQQAVTLKRTVNGEVIETEKRTVTYSRDEPYRETEAGRTTIERLKAAFDGEALTRTEAFEEAKIDFVIADADRNELITAMEFTTLVENWRKNKTRAATAPNEDNSRQRQYDAFLEEIDPESSALRRCARRRQRSPACRPSGDWPLPRSRRCRVAVCAQLECSSASRRGTAPADRVMPL